MTGCANDPQINFHLCAQISAHLLPQQITQFNRSINVERAVEAFRKKLIEKRESYAM